MKAIINSKKHIVQRTLNVVGEQTIHNVKIAEAQAIEPVAPDDVVVGAVIKAVFCEYWLHGESAQPCTANWSLEKLPNNGTAMTYGFSQTLDTYPNKHNILKMGQGVIGDSNSNPIPVIREWIKIPKGKQRFALGDELLFNVSCTGEADNGLEVCGFSLYKEYQ